MTESSSLIEKRKSVRVGFVIPTKIELQAYFGHFPGLHLIEKHPWEWYSASHQGVELLFIVSYIGPANAAAATERLMSFAPDAVLHSGSAGAMNPELMPGDIVIGRSYKPLCSPSILEARKSLLLSNKGIRFSQDGEGVHVEQLEADGNLLGVSAVALEKAMPKLQAWSAAGWPAAQSRRVPKAVFACLGSQDGWTKDKRELDFIRAEFGVDCEDMESAFVAQIAAKHRVPFLAVRGISNNEYLGTLEKGEIIPAVREAASNAACIAACIAAEMTNLREQ